MSRTTRQAAKYERLYPETGVEPAQAAERMDRIEYRRERPRSRRTRSILVPEIPWRKTR